eukprot:5156570-Amphidinium_carterae.1
MHLEKIRGLRHPMEAQTVDSQILAAISYFTHNPNNWSEECNHIPPLMNAESTSAPDIRLRLAVEPIMCVSNPAQNPKLKRYRERRTSNTSDFHVDMESIETDYIALLPMHLIWCYDELNCYVKTGEVSLSFAMEMRE